MKKGCLLAILGLFLCFGQASAGLYTLNPTADAAWGSMVGVPSITLTANDSILQTGYYNSYWYTTLLKFDVSSLSGQTITGATLNLYSVGASTMGLTGTNAYYAQNGWTEASIPGTIVSGATQLIGSNTTGGQIAQWHTWNLTLQPSMLTSGPLSIAIMESGAQSGLPHHQFASREYTDSLLIPYLSVTTAAAPVPIPGALWLLGSGLIGLIGIRRRFKK
jgi:hypothetical protein